MTTFKNLPWPFCPRHDAGRRRDRRRGADGRAPLTVQVYNADAGSFHVNAVLVAGKTDAVLLDTGFTRADALRIAAMVLDSKKTLKTIYISQADPDYYFGIEVLKQYFPDAKVRDHGAHAEEDPGDAGHQAAGLGPAHGRQRAEERAACPRC